MDVEMVEGHDENEHDGHDKTCQIHDDHWQDDFAYVSEKRLPVPVDAPRTADMARMIGEMDDVPVYRFAVVFVNAETGNIQLSTSPGVSAPASINLLAKAISVLAFQEAYEERMAEQLLASGLKGALAKAIQGDGELPDLSRIFGGEKTTNEVIDDVTNMREGYL